MKVLYYCILCCLSFAFAGTDGGSGGDTGNSAGFNSQNSASNDGNDSQNSNQTMSLDDVISQAYSNNPELKSAIAEKQARDEELARAFSEYYPDINVKLSTGHKKHRERDADWVPLSRDRNMTQNDSSAAVVLTQNIFKGLGTKYKVESAEASVIANRHNASFKIQEVIFKIIRAYMELWAAEQNVLIAEKLKDNLKMSLDSEERKLQVGTTTMMDCEQKRSAYADAVYELSGAKADLKRALAEFKAVTCVDAFGHTVFPALKITLPKTLGDFMDNAMKNNPKLLAARFSEYAAAKNVGVAKSVLSPSIDIELAAESDLAKLKGDIKEQGRHNKKSGALSAKVNITVPILTRGGVSFSDIRQSNKMALKATMDYKTVIYSTEQECRSIWGVYKAVIEQIEQSKISVDSAAKTVEGLRQSERLGRVSSTDVVYNERNLLTSRRKEVDARKKLILTECQIVLCDGSLESIVKTLPVKMYDIIENEKKVRHAPFSF